VTVKCRTAIMAGPDYSIGCSLRPLKLWAPKLEGPCCKVEIIWKLDEVI
jgi:hypothetical protein